MTVENDVSEQPREGIPKRAVKPTWLRAQPEYISWKGMMSQTDSKEPAEEQHNTSEDLKTEDSDWEDISRREVNNCSSDYYGNYIKERAIEQGEWFAVSEVPIPQSTEEWFRPPPKSPKGKRSSTTTATTTTTTTTAVAASNSNSNNGHRVKGWVHGVQKCLRPKKRTPSSETRISDEAYVEINTSGESDTDTDADDWLPLPLPLLQKRPDTPLPRGLLRVGAQQQRRGGRGRDSCWAEGLGEAARQRGSGCTVFYAPMLA
ncbi:hypothetical protein F4815DRAFT_267103 [Daldinia loculata]|nr:hypothetical protein F4815DRAFT_267103 [Daldinia loculata]